MPLSDLLWACPACGQDRGLTNSESRCTTCGTRFLRGTGARIRAVAPDGTETARSPAEWLDRLPDPSTLLSNDPVRTARVFIRPATGEDKVFGAAGFLNRIETFGDEAPGSLTLHPSALTVRHEPEGEGKGKGDGEGEGKASEAAGTSQSWPLETFTAVQTSSKSLQIKRKGKPLVSFRFLDDSVYFWEQLVRAALRDFYGRTGRGEIREFQPRIETTRSRT